MATGPRPSKILETIREVAVIQEQLAKLTEAVVRLTVRVESLEGRTPSDMT
jgi:hypothetical protein